MSGNCTRCPSHMPRSRRSASFLPRRWRASSWDSARTAWMTTGSSFTKRTTYTSTEVGRDSALTSCVLRMPGETTLLANSKPTAIRSNTERATILTMHRWRSGSLTTFCSTSMRECRNASNQPILVFRPQPLGVQPASTSVRSGGQQNLWTMTLRPAERLLLP